ncbi:MAG TPA: flagellar biosynthetic protein FliR [Vicinamibacterales bacterium]|nr:flagellar biosynthetic protein FliR [Vicinamibacterales bacterium]
MIDVAPLARFGLLLVRPGMLIVAAPPFGGTFAPAQVKIGLTVLIALALAPVVPVPMPGPAAALSLVVVREVAIGLALALAIRALVAAAELAGQLAGFQMGLSYGATVDPQSGVRNTLLATLYSELTVFTLLLANVHHTCVRAIARSYAALPIGVGTVDGSMPQIVVRLLGVIFTIGARLATPIVAVVLVAEIALGLLARSAPSLNLMVASPSVRVLVGLVALAVLAPSVISVTAGLADGVIRLGIDAMQAFR